ncbi:MAG TPA: PDZ domain-containing protein [bacterium]|mgnify:CR=1 FL=1|nr:PDZ domain-containing protein [bacterium]HPN35193.1 PDZ domain-containing protein [bacterium]
MPHRAGEKNKELWKRPVFLPRWRVSRLLAVLYLWVCLVVPALLYPADLSYTLAFDQLTWKYITVTIQLENPFGRRLLFSMPNWIPGAYEWGSFGDQVIDFSAVDRNGAKLAWEKLSRSDWEVQGGEGLVTIAYTLKPFSRSYWGTGLDSTGALLEGAATWMRVRDSEKAPVRVRVHAPAGWRIATGLTGEAGGSWVAADYDELADCPFLLGALSDTAFFVDGARHELYFHGEAAIDRPAFAAMIGKIVAAQSRLMGGLPYSRYVFQFILSDDERGSSGLEHRNSTTIRLPSLEVMKDVRSAASIISHEFFHLWNVKRITNAAFAPLNYQQEARTESLWWFEGVTSYYADLALLRSGVWTVDDFLRHQAREIERLQENPDRLRTTLAQASWRVWQNGFAGPGISYYNKGQLLGLLLDVMIRKATHNEKSLDHVLHYLYHTYARAGRGVGDDEWADILRQVVGKDFTAFLDRYLYGLVELPFQEILAFAGLQAVVQTEPTPFIGAIRIIGPRNRVFSLDETSAAGRAGLRRNDLILSLDDQAFKGEAALYEWVGKKTIGDTVRLLISRDGVQWPLTVPVEKRDQISCSLSLSPDPDPVTLAIRNSLLSGP